MTKPKAPETVWETWNELAQACEEILETWSNETVLFLASAEGNLLISEAAVRVLDVREANGEYIEDES